MNISMRLTMDGLIRSLKGFAHDLADALEHSGREALRREELSSQPGKPRSARATERVSDESGR